MKDYTRQRASALLLASSIACAPQGASPAPRPVDAIVPTSAPDSVESFSLLASYRWNTAQRDSAMAVLMQNQVKWEQHRPLTYEYWEHSWCFCITMWSGPHLLVIHDKQLVSATDTSRRRTDSTYLKEWQGKDAGIDALFAQLASGIRDTTFAEVRVSYDEAQGYPVDITYDRSVMASDDELYVTVSHFTALPAIPSSSRGEILFLVRIL